MVFLVPLVFAPIIAAIVAFIVWLVQRLVFKLTFKITGLAVLISVVIAAYAAFIVAVYNIIQSLTVSMPLMVINVWSWVMPSNFYSVSVSILTVQILKYVYERYRELLLTSGKVLIGD